MSDMVEKVKAAIEFLTHYDYERCDEAFMNSLLEKAARAAIEAMREPTEEMLGAAEPCMDDFGSYDSRDELRRAYPAMIDAALSTKGE